MKTISNEFKTHLGQEVTTLCTCWKLVRRDGTKQGFTNHVTDITYTDDDADTVTYEAATGFTPSNIVSTEDLAVNNLDIIGLLDSSGIGESDIAAGLYDEAEVYIFMLNYEDLTMGDMKMSRGNLGEVTTHRNSFVAEFRGMSQKLQQTIGEVFSVTCRADLFDAKCGLILRHDTWVASTAYEIGDTIEATSFNERYYECTTAGTSDSVEPTWGTTIDGTTNDNTVVWTCRQSWLLTGTITTVTSQENFADSARTEADDYFNFGLLTWTSGNNAGLSMEIKAYASDTFQLSLPMPYVVQVGDAYTVYAGCDKTSAVCIGTFDNKINSRMEDYIPGLDETVQFGGQ